MIAITKTGRTSPSANGAKNVVGIRCIKKSTKPDGAAWLVYWATTAGSMLAGSMFMPTPGFSRCTVTRPITKAVIVSA